MAQPDSTSTPPSPFELDQRDAYSKYLLYSRTEILFVLRAIVQKGALITVYFDHGESFLLTSLLEVSADSDALIFDYGNDEEMNRKAIAASKLTLTTSLDRVKVQFVLQRFALTQKDGRPAFRSTLPETLLRLQRREYYRLSTPVAEPLNCSLTMPRADGSSLVVAQPLLDISGGGVGLMVPPDSVDEFPVGKTLPDCRIVIPEEGTITVTLCVRNAFDVVTKAGTHYLRIGCEFVKLPGTRLAAIQRYITRIERERKARLSGMA